MAAIVVAVLVGTSIGLGLFTFVYARGSAYMKDDPRACANCHVMNDQYAGWQRSSHHAVATCNDCHTPHGFFGKYFTKALNGWHHSKAFTTGDFHEPIRIGARNRGITEQQCRHCHEQLTSLQLASERATGRDVHAETGDGLSCIRCHDSVGHRTAK